MKKHFISVLGASVYKPCSYVEGTQFCNSKFVQEATLKLACAPMTKEDQITICLTEKAREKNWIDREYDEKENERNHGKAGEIYVGLKTILEKDFISPIQDLSISTGKTEEELSDMFQEIYDCIGPDEEIYFDITHGLRNIPMLVMAVLEYAKVTKNISIGGIYYGAFEVGEKDPDYPFFKVPLYDLGYYSDILNWSKGAEAFVKYGNSNAILDLFTEHWNQTQPTNEEEGIQRKKKLGNLKEMVRALNLLTRCIETGRGKKEKSDTCSIVTAYQKYEICRNKVSEELQGNYRPLGALVEKIDEKLQPFQKTDNLGIGLATIQWSIDNGMLQQGYTALEETIKTFLCNQVGVPDDTEFWRDTFCKNILNYLNFPKQHPNYLSQTEAESFDGWTHDVITIRSLFSEEAYKKNHTSSEKILEYGKTAFSLLYETDSHKLLIPLSSQVGETRNSINHFGFNARISVDAFRDNLYDYFKRFQEIIENW